MSGILICSMESHKPYYIKELDMNVYSLEEIAYYLYNHVYLVDESFFCEKLINYIDNDLKQNLVANGIRQALEHNRTLVELISFVVKSAGYYNQTELMKLQKELDILGTKSGIERLKAKGDILLSCKKYNSAFECYKYIMLKNREITVKQSFYGNVYNNMGVVCANMFKYKEAAHFFREGYKIGRDLLVLRQLLIADILGNDMKGLNSDARAFNASEKMLSECKAKINAAKMEPIETLDTLEKTINRMIHEYKADV